MLWFSIGCNPSASLAIDTRYSILTTESLTDEKISADDDEEMSINFTVDAVQ